MGDRHFDLTPQNFGLVLYNLNVGTKIRFTYKISDKMDAKLFQSIKNAFARVSPLMIPVDLTQLVLVGYEIFLGGQSTISRTFHNFASFIHLKIPGRMRLRVSFYRH